MTRYPKRGEKKDEKKRTMQEDSTQHSSTETKTANSRRKKQKVDEEQDGATSTINPAKLKELQKYSRQPRKTSTHSNKKTKSLQNSECQDITEKESAQGNSTNNATTNQRLLFPDNDVFAQILKNKKTIQVPAPQAMSRALSSYSCNVVHYLKDETMGLKHVHKQRQSIKSPVNNILSNLQLFKTSSSFDRRCTALEWHPTNPNVLAVGSKGGDIVLWNVNKVENDAHIPGMGPGGSIQAMKFHPQDTSKLFTSSIDGTVSLQDLKGKNKEILADTMNCHEGPGGNVSGMKFNPKNSLQLYTSALDGKVMIQDFHGKFSQTFLDTMTWDFWYCSLDINPSKDMLVTGDNVGNVTMLSMAGKKLWNIRLHKNKVTHAEFSPREDWLLCTASTDSTVQLWDVRMIKDRKSVLQVLKHDKPVNSAYFSLMDGTKLLTTDQHHEIRVYSAPCWHLQRSITHPHRFFQHLTPIKAYWHPLQDTAVIGRYPDDKMAGHVQGEKRTIDMFDVDSGETICQLYDPAAPGIISLNKFNHIGDTLAATMGLNILIWKRKEELAAEQEALMTNMKKSMGSSNSSRSSNQRKRKPAEGKMKKNPKDKEDKKQLKSKLKLKKQQK